MSLGHKKINKKYERDIYSIIKRKLVFIIITFVFLFFVSYNYAYTDNGYGQKVYTVSDLKNSKTINLINLNDIFIFGRYEQDAIEENGKEEIEWFILDHNVEKRELTLLSVRLLDCLPFHNKREYATWETCSLRQWLNNDFYNEAFDDNEKSFIKTTYLMNRENPEYHISSGNNTIDKIYLMDVYDAVDYFDETPDTYKNKFRYNKSTNMKRKSVATPYAVKNGLRVVTDMQRYYYSGNYWLRTSGNSVLRPWYYDVMADCYQCIIREDGGVRFDGTAVHSLDDGVRPMMKIQYK